jgi:hypothetical protein
MSGRAAIAAAFDVHASPEGPPRYDARIGREVYPSDSWALDALERGDITVGGWTRVRVVYGPDELLVDVSNDAPKIGGDLRVRTSILAAQLIADNFGALLPTAGIMEAAWKQAKVRLVPHPRGQTAMMSIGEWLAHDAQIDAEIAGRTGLISPLGKEYMLHPWLLKPHAVDPVTHFAISGPDAATMGGWIWPNGVWIQSQGAGASFAHEARYKDYSHLERLVARACILNGLPADLADVYRSHPDLVMGGRRYGMPVPSRHPWVSPGLPPGTSSPGQKPRPGSSPPSSSSGGVNVAGAMLGVALLVVGGALAWHFRLVG